MRAWLALPLLLAACGSSSPGSGSCLGPGELCDDLGTCAAPPADRVGEATYYDFADGSGNCSFDATPDDLMVGAMNDHDYAGSFACGACVEVDGPDGSVKIRVVDRCPECPEGDIDLSPEAFELVAPLPAGRVDIAWRYVACEPSGGVVLRFKDGANPWWTAVQVRNARYPIGRFEYLAPDGTFVEVARESYNYFVEPSGMGEGPFTFRITDAFGHEIVEEGVALPADTSAPVDVQGSQQFPSCG